MPNFTDALEGAVRSTTCGLLAANDNIQGWWARNPDLPFTDTLAAGATAARRALCDNPSPVPNIPSDIGDRGQCSDTTYRVRFRYREFNDQGAQIRERISSNIFFFGGLKDYRLPNTSVGQSSIGYCWETCTPPGDVSTFIFDTSAGNTATKEIIEYEVVSGPDNCGGVAPDQPAPIFRPGPQPISITYIDNSNTEITELGDFNLLVPVFLPGSITIPFNVDFGGVQIDGRLNINGDITFEISPGRQPDDTVTDTEPPALPPGQEPDDPETERRIIGVHVFTTLPPNTPVTTIFQEDGPNIFAPRGGSVRFLVTGGGGSSWTRDIDIKGDRQYIACPAPQGAISVVANELPGGTVSLIRVYGSIPEYLIPGN